MFRTYFHFASFAPTLLTNSKGDLRKQFARKQTVKNLAGYYYKVSRSIAEFEALRDDWNDLFDRSHNKDQPFQSFAWHWQWAETYLNAKENMGADSELFIITLWKNGVLEQNDTLVMLWPMHCKTFLGRNHLHFMGEPVSQYGDVLLDENEDSVKLLHETWRHIQNSMNVDLLVLRKVKKEAAIYPLLKDLQAPCTETEQGLFINYQNYQDFDDYQKRVKPKERKNRKRKRRRLQGQGALSVSFLTSGVEASYFARQAIKLKKQWLEQKGLVSKAFQDEKTEQFFGEIAQSTDKNININLSVLHVGNKPAAITISFGAKGYRAMHINVIDLAYEKDSPGVSLLEDTIKNSMQQGDKVLDFLAPADPYKLIWCDDIHYVEDFTLSTNLLGQFYTTIALKWIRHGGKNLFKKLPASSRNSLVKTISGLLWNVKK